MTSAEFTELLNIPSGTTVDMQELMALERVARAAVTSATAARQMTRPGSHRSLQRFRGLEYTESREYLPGDDVRRMDWPVTARLGKPHTKLFHEDNNRNTWLVVDLAGSMHFGTRNAFKSVHASHVTAFWCWSATLKGDTVNATLLGENSTLELSSLRGRRGASELLHALLEFANHKPVGMRPELDARRSTIARLSRSARYGNAVIVSDFAHLSAAEARDIAVIGRRLNTMLVRVTDPLESTRLPPGRYLVSDGSQVRAFETQANAQQGVSTDSYATTSSHLQDLVRHGIDCIEVATDQSPLAEILSVAQ